MLLIVFYYTTPQASSTATFNRPVLRVCKLQVVTMSMSLPYHLLPLHPKHFATFIRPQPPYMQTPGNDNIATIVHTHWLPLQTQLATLQKPLTLPWYNNNTLLTHCVTPPNNDHVPQHSQCPTINHINVGLKKM